MRVLGSPIVKTAAAAVVSFVVVLLLHTLDSSTIAPSVGLWFLTGALYAQLLEYAHHRVLMHRGLRLRFFLAVKRNHLRHHRIFHGPNFQTRRQEDLLHVAGKWWAFPSVFLAHYVLLLPLIAPAPLVMFLFGAVVHYLLFELSHWFTHVKDNVFDRVVAKIPMIRGIRAHQIEHHRLHHEIPDLAFNFNAPYIGDRLFGKMPQPVTEPAPEVPLAVAFPPPRLALPRRSPPLAAVLQRPIVRYGSAVAVGVALVGLAVMAHGWWRHDRVV